MFGIEFMIRQQFSIGGLIPITGFIRYKNKFKKVLSKKQKYMILKIK